MGPIPKNPFTEERRQELKESAQKFLTSFSIQYMKAFGGCLLESIIEEGEDNANPKKLQYRDWDVIERPNLFRGRVYFKSGNGPGTWSKWQEAYVAETQDYKIRVYKTEKDCNANKKPLNEISPCGYTIVKNVSQHYKHLLLQVGPDMGLSEEEMNTLASLSPYAWAVFHPLRTNYVFQLHPGQESGGGCLCLGGGGATVEPDDMGEKEAKEGRPQTIAFMQRCASKCKVRDLSTVKGKAFDQTVQAMVMSQPTLSYFRDDGTEPEILTDMLVRHCIVPLQKPMLNELGQVPAKFKIKLWMKTKELIQTGMINVITPAWTQMEAGVEALQKKIEPTIRQTVPKIQEVREQIRSKVKDKVTDKIGEAVNSHVSPHLRKLMLAFEQPMNKGFEQQKKILNDIDVVKLPADEKARNLKLDMIARAGYGAREMEKAADDIIEQLQGVKDMADIFNFMEVETYRQETEDMLLKILDAAAYTLQQKLKNAEGLKPELKDQVIQDWEVDVQLAKGGFLKTALKTIIIGGVKKALAPVVDPILDPIDEVIPDAMQEFLSARGLYNDIVDHVIGEHINTEVDKAYPPPNRM